MNICARVVEILSGMAYEDFLQKRFFDPLGMTETTFWPSDEQFSRLARAYGSNNDKSGGAVSRNVSADEFRLAESLGGKTTSRFTGEWRFPRTCA